MLEEIINGIIARLTGPMNFRFILQPIVAIILAIRDGNLDAKAGEPAIILDLIRNPMKRKVKLTNVFYAIVKPVLVGIVIDAIFQFMILGSIKPLAALFVGTFVIAFPYMIFRGLSDRFFTFRMNHSKADKKGNLKKEISV